MGPLPAGTLRPGPGETAKTGPSKGRPIGTCAKAAPDLGQKLRAFVLLSQCQAELARELGQALLQAASAAARVKHRRPPAPPKRNG